MRADRFFPLSVCCTNGFETKVFRSGDCVGGVLVHCREIWMSRTGARGRSYYCVIAARMRAVSRAFSPGIEIILWRMTLPKDKEKVPVVMGVKGLRALKRCRFVVLDVSPGVQKRSNARNINDSSDFLIELNLYKYLSIYKKEVNLYFWNATFCKFDSDRLPIIKPEHDSSAFIYRHSGA